MKSRAGVPLVLTVVGVVVLGLTLAFVAVGQGGLLRPSPAAARVVDHPLPGGGLALLQPTPSPLPSDFVEAADREYILMGNVYERVSPSVVNIDVAINIQIEEENLRDVGSGSGFVYDLDGHIVTNSHVVRDADGIRVTFRDGYVADAELVGLDDFSDLAVIRVDVDPARLLPVTLAEVDKLYVGERVIAIGNPFGLASSMTTGMISALGRTLPSGQLLDPNLDRYNNPSIIQVDAEINPGNSGGPLLNSYGEVIGVNTAIRTETGIFQGVGFAVPVSTVLRVVPELIETGEVRYSRLGISSLSPEGGFTVAGLAEPLGLPVTQGVLIQEVTLDSPAARAGLQGGTEELVLRGLGFFTGGDIIVAIDDVFIETMDDLVSYLVVHTRPGDEVTLTVIRGDQTLEVPVTLDSR